MKNTVTKKSYSLADFDEKEILRYAGLPSDFSDLDELIYTCENEIYEVIAYDVCYAEFDISVSDDVIDFGFCRQQSASAAKNLSGCESIILFAATLGLGVDRLINKYSKLSPSKAIILEAIAAERIEKLCDRFCEEISALYTSVKPRFSPGYGDLPLEFQKDIFRVLDCRRQIGLTLNESLSMSPRKSVTAFIGVNGE